MSNLVFHTDGVLTLGAELELQLIDPSSQRLVARAKDLIRNISDSEHAELIKPEITQSMIELNSSIHRSPQTLYKELTRLARFLMLEGQRLGIYFCGGGTHPIQEWREHKIFPTSRYKNVSWQYRYLAKRFTVFSLHLHVGCKDGDDAIYLAHMLARYVPQFIALSASSPFYQNIDTSFSSARLNVVNAFPLSGTMPFVLNWREFSEYYFKMRSLKIIKNMKDFYWDVRPKPKFGTVEIRVCDAPLTLQRATTLIAYIQALARYILLEKPHPLTQDLYHLYNYNRFQACRYGFDGNIVDPFTLKNMLISNDILQTLQMIKPHARALDTMNYLRQIQMWVQTKHSDAAWLRNIYVKTGSLETVIKHQCKIWASSLK